jgi:hypothetical protein
VNRYLIFLGGECLNDCGRLIFLFHFQNGDETSENAQSGKGKKIVTIVLRKLRLCQPFQERHSN